ncbi:Alkaline phosphatase, tissue-nonspecific isozyme [Araneus ventricosus]|uniref:alkaline phosphatase n=1 Tax=Araneus ventricosus TaxID=182803 RepID=A0A4Y2X122_ARAVE|nr:Alkaline phosphatase, tissue-nonspecific isozyme [Araneus ventricosus]
MARFMARIQWVGYPIFRSTPLHFWSGFHIGDWFWSGAQVNVQPCSLGIPCPFFRRKSGRIDHAHHLNNAKRALSETVSMADAVQAAINMTSSKDTLIVVTADHSHVLTVNGYPKRGNPILGVAGTSNKDNLTYTTLLYTNGPSYHMVNGKRRNLNGTDTGTKVSECI